VECTKATTRAFAAPRLWRVVLQHASSLPLARIRRPQRISAALTRPPPFPLRSAALDPSLRRPSPSTPPLFTPTFRSAARTTSPRRAPARPTAREQLPRISPRRAAVAIREVANPSTERRTATYDHLLIERNSYRSRPHSVTSIPHPPSYYSANYACTSQASRRPTAPPPSTTDRHRPPSDPLTFNRRPSSYGSPNCAYNSPRKRLLAQQKIQQHPQATP
jgi:hypothetical protein